MKVKLIIDRVSGHLFVDSAMTEKEIEKFPDRWADCIASSRGELRDGDIDAFGVVDIEVNDALIASAFYRTAVQEKAYALGNGGGE